MAIIRSGLSKIGSKIVAVAETGFDDEIPFVPAFDLLNKDSLSDEEISSVGAALSLLIESDPVSTTWSIAALLEGIGNRL